MMSDNLSQPLKLGWAGGQGFALVVGDPLFVEDTGEEGDFETLRDGAGERFDD